MYVYNTKNKNSNLITKHKTVSCAVENFFKAGNILPLISKSVNIFFVLFFNLVGHGAWNHVKDVFIFALTWNDYTHIYHYLCNDDVEVKKARKNVYILS